MFLSPLNVIEAHLQITGHWSVDFQHMWLKMDL